MIFQQAVWADSEAEGIALFNQGNFAAALPIFQSLAEEDNIKADYYLGMMHYFGYGVPPNPAEAKTWFLKAALQGHAASQTYLGELLIVERHYLYAYQWLELSVQQGHTSGRKYLNKLTTLMTAKEIEEAHRMALRCKTSHFKECEE